MERRTRGVSYRIGARAAPWRVGEGERNSVWPDSGTGEETGGCHSKNDKRSTNPASGRGDGGGHRRSRFQLDAYSSLAAARGRARKAGQTGGTFAFARCRTG